jgi:uncharacterized protein (DUF1330 family)
LAGHQNRVGGWQDQLMTTYLIADTDVHDSEGYEQYKALARPIAEKFGGEYLVRGGELRVDDDDLWSPTRLVIISFPDRDAASAFLDSDEYAPVKEMRRRFAKSTLVMVEGGLPG